MKNFLLFPLISWLFILSYTTTLGQNIYNTGGSPLGLCGSITIYDDGGASGNYSNSDYEMVICSDDGNPITFTVSNLDLAGFAGLEIFDGQSTSFSDRIYRDNDGNNVTITSTSSCITIEFEGHTSAAGGFQLDVSTSCIAGPGTCSDGVQNQGEQGVDCGGPCAACTDFNISNTTLNTCNATIYDNGGPSGDQTGTANTMTICSDDGSALQFDVILMDVGNDDFVVHAGTTTTDPIVYINTFGSAGGTGVTVTRSTCITMYSEGSTFSGNAGFEIAISCIPPSCSDGIQNQDETGIDCGGVCPYCLIPAPTDCSGNIVNNGDFETTTNVCGAADGGPYGVANQIPRIWYDQTPADGWFGTARRIDNQISFPTADYYNNCTNTSSIGCMNGSGSMGYWAHFSGNENGEYIQSQLSQAMEAGEEYCIQVRASTLRGSSTNYPPSDKFGMYFHNNTYASGDGFIDYVADNGGASFLGAGTNVNITPSVVNTPGNMLNTSCQDLTFSYCADGGEQYVIVGNFTPGPAASGDAEYISFDDLIITKSCPITFDSQINASSTPDCAGSCADLTAVASNQQGGCYYSEDFSYQWYENGVLLVGETNQVLLNVCPTVNTVYSVEITYNAGCKAFTKPESETVYNVVCSGFIVTVNDETICNGSDAVLTATPDPASGSYTYSWVDLSDGSNAGNTQTITVSPNSTRDYEVTVSDGTDTEVATATVTVNQCCDLEVVSATTPSTCGDTDGTVDVTITGSASYDISIGGTIVENAATAGNYSYTGYSDGQYQVMVVSTLDPTCDSIFNVDVTLTDLSPTFTVTPNDALTCGGDGTLVIAGLIPGTSYDYSYNDGTGLVGPITITSDGAGEILVDPAAQGSYTDFTVSLTANTLCVTTDAGPYVVGENTSFNPTVTFVDPTVCGGNGTITIDGLTASSPYNVDINDGNGSLVVNSNTSGSFVYSVLAGSYDPIIVIDNTTNCQATLTGGNINDPTTFAVDSIGGVQPSCLDNDGSLDIDVPGVSGSETYSWSSGQTTQDLTGIGAGVYTVTVTDAGCSGTLTLELDAAPPIIFTVNAQNPSVCGASDGEIIITVPTANVDYDVDIDGVVTTETAIGTTITIGGFSGSDLVGVVSLTEVLTGCSGTDNTGWSFTDPGAPTITNINSDEEYCVGGSTVLLATGSAGVVTLADDQGGVFNDGDEVFPVITTIYTATVTDGACTATEFFTVTVNNPPVFTISATSDPTTCISNDGTITISGLTPNTAYNVNDGSGVQSVTSDGAGDIVLGGYGATTISSITVEDPVTGCSAVDNTGWTLVAPGAPVINPVNPDETYCEGGTTTLNAVASSGTLTWSDDMGGTHVNGDVVSPSSSTVYTVVADDNGCTTSASFTVTVIPNPSIVLNSQDAEYCEGEAIADLSATATSGTVNWYDTGSVLQGSGNAFTPANLVGAQQCYQVQADDNGCLSPLEGPVCVTINPVPQTPQVTSSNGANTFCSSDIVVLTTGSSNVVWSSDPMGSTVAAQGTDFIIDNASPGTYTIYLVDAVGSCIATNSYTYIVEDNGYLELPDTIVSCFGSPIQIIADASNTVTWSDGTVSDTLLFTPGSSTIVSASMVGTCNTITKDVVILVYQNPIVNAGADQSVPRGTYVNVEGSGAEQYQWDLINNTANVDYLDCNTCPSTGGYILFTSLYTLTGWNEYGCPDVDTLLITIDGEISVYVPNIFSPNNDGDNDVFKVYGPDFYMFTLTVFNRWGEVIFETDNNTEGWDGTWRGKQVGTGVYMYLIEGQAVTGHDVNLQGNVTLVR